MAYYTLNFDVSHNNQANTASAGCIIRDYEGDLVVAAFYNLTEALSYYDVAIAEAIGLRKGLQLAHEHDLDINLIKGDNKEVIDLVLGLERRQPRPALARIIAEIKEMIVDQEGIIDIRVINRADNRVADKLAYWGTVYVHEEVFTDCTELPPGVAELIQQEKVINRNEQERDMGAGIRRGTPERNEQERDVGLGMRRGAQERNAPERNEQERGVGMGLGLGGIFGVAATLVGGAMLAMRAYNALAENETPNSYTLQYFGSDRNQLHKARGGFIIKNRGEFFMAAAYNLDNQYPDCNVAIAEAIVLWNGLKMARYKNIRLSSIEGRNVEVRDRVLGRERRPPTSRDLTEFIDKIESYFYERGIDAENILHHVEGGAIQVVRELAIEGGRLTQTDIKVYASVEELPLRVANMVNGHRF